MSQTQSANTPAPVAVAALTQELQASIDEWTALTKWLEKGKKRELELRNTLAELFVEPKEGVNHLHVGGLLDFVLDYKVNRKLDEQVLDTVMSELPEDSPYRQLGVLITYKPQLVLGGYRSLPADQKLIFCQALTETPGTPSLEIKPLKGSPADPATAPQTPDWPATRKITTVQGGTMYHQTLGQEPALPGTEQALATTTKAGKRGGRKAKK